MQSERLKKLDAAVREASKDYYHTRPLVRYKTGDSEACLDLRSVLVAAAITNNNVLLTGSTGCGKTHLAKMVMAALFGDAYSVLQMDASFSLDKLRDISFKTIAEGGRLHDAVQDTPLVKAAGVIIDEYNRAPSEITNIIQGWLQNGVLTFEGGRECYPGATVNGELYQWKIATVNEGSRYAGVRRLDKASRDRLAVEIPLDVFSPTEEDRRRLRSKTSTSVNIAPSAGMLEDVIALLQETRQVKLTSPAEEFLLYLQRMNQCVKAPNKTKLEIEHFSPEYCKGCRLSRDANNVCGSVYAPSDRSIIALQNLARGFAMVRAGTVADIEDVLAAAPFVLLSKMDIHPGWVDSTSQCSKWQAVNNVLKMAYQRFQKFVKENYRELAASTPDSAKAIKKYAAEQDAWAAELP